ncbi:MAG TPA: (2Fe-2S)-binding protein [Acidisphaera sp.]|nr:(2Fe-2S)-binding protein [Acidisphaera sp.]
MVDTNLVLDLLRVEVRSDRDGGNECLRYRIAVDATGVSVGRTTRPPLAVCLPAARRKLGNLRAREMYVCHCNALDDRQLRQAVRDGADRPFAVYAACGCRALCGSCAGTVVAIIRDGASGRRGVQQNQEG